MADSKRLPLLALVNTTLRIGTIVSQFAANILVARMLSPSEAGYYLTYWAAVAFAAIVGNFGLRTASVRWIAGALAEGKQDDARAALLTTSRMSHLAFLCLSILVATSLLSRNALLDEHSRIDSSITALLVIWSVLWGLQYSLSEVFRGFSNHILPGITGGLLSNILFIIGIALCVICKIELDLYSILVVTLIAYFINYLVIVVSIFTISRRLPKGGQFLIRQAWKQAMATSVAQVALGTIQILDVPIVEMVSSAEEAAYYGVASRIAVFVSLPLQIAFSTALPSMTALVCDNNTAGLQRLVKRLAISAAVPSLLFAVAASVLGPYFLPIVFGADYAKSANYLPLLMLYQSAIVFGGLSGALLLAGGMERTSMKLSVVAAIACLPLQFVLGSLLGPVSIPLVSFAVVLALSIAQIEVCRQKFGVDCSILPFAILKPKRI